MVKFRSILLALVSIISIVPGSVSCKKDALPKASIYVYNQNHEPVTGLGVRFYVKDLNASDYAFDSTIVTDATGLVSLTLEHEAYLDVNIKYTNAENQLISIESNAKLISNEHFIDTLYIF